MLSPGQAEAASSGLASGSRSWPHTAWESWKARATPAGALTFHLAAWSRRGLSETGQASARLAMERLGVDHFLVAHGSALLRAGGATLLCGPSGIGKSSLLANLERSGAGVLVEDGLVLLGVGPPDWTLVTTGTRELMRRSARVARRLRRLIGIDRTSWLDTRPGTEPDPSRLLPAALDRVSRIAFLIGVATTRPRQATFIPAACTVERLVVAFHPADPLTAVRVRRDGTVETIRDLRAEAPPGVLVVSVDPVGERSAVVARMRSAVLGVPE